MAATAGKATKAQSQSQQQFAADSSDDEIPVPMKLSAFTKALLDDGHPEASNGPAATERPTSPPARPPSRVMTRRGALGAVNPSTAEDREARRESLRLRDTRRHARAGSAQLPSSRPSSPAAAPAPTQGHDNSPAPRKRVVRLSGSVRNSVSASTQKRKLESAEKLDEKNQPQVHLPLQSDQLQQQAQPLLPQQQQAEQAEQPEQLAQPESQQQPPVDINTPVLPVRTVRIAVGSSGQKVRSGGSSAISKRSGALSDQEGPEDPGTIGRSQAAASQSSASRYTAGKRG